MNKESPLIGIIITDRELKITSWNLWLEEVTGISSKEAEGKKLIDLFPDMIERGILKHIEEVLEGGFPKVLSHTFHKYLIPVKPSFPSKYFDKMQQLVTISPLKSRNEIIGLIITIEDITEKLEEEKDLLEKLKNSDEKTRLNIVKILSQKDRKGLLLDTFSDKSWRIRRSAVYELKNTRDKEFILTLIEKLKKEYRNIDVLNSILDVLSTTSLDILDVLEALLDFSDPDLRIYTTLILSNINDQRAEDLLIKALSDENPNVVFNAIEGLGKMKSQKAIPYLINLVEKKDLSLSFPAIEALKNIGDPVVIPKLFPLLEDDLFSPLIIETLGTLGDDSSISFLVDLLNRRDQDINLIVDALYKIYEKYENTYKEGEYIKDLVKNKISPSGIQNLLNYLSKAKKEELKSIISVLSWIEHPLVEKALTRFIGNPEVRNEVIETIVRYGKKIVPILVEKLKDDDFEIRFSAVLALGSIGDSSAVPHLIEVLLKDRELAVVSAGALAKIGDRRAFEPLISMLGDPDPLIRQAVISALNSLGHPDMPKRIRELLKDKNPLVRESAVRIAGYFGYEECKDLIFGLTQDEEKNVRIAVYENLDLFEDERVYELLSLGVKSKDKEIRRAIARSAIYFNESYFPIIEELFRDEDPWVRYYTLKAFRYMNIPNSLNILKSLLEKEDSNLVKTEILELMGEIGRKEVIPLIVPFLDSDDKDLVRAAIFSLGKIKDKETIPYIIKMLKSQDFIVRLEAVRALKGKQGVGVVESLQWVLGLESDLKIIEEGLNALVSLSTLESLKAILSLAIDPNKREFCISSLSHISDEKIEEFWGEIEKMSKQNKIFVIQALERKKTPKAVEKLFEFLKDKDPEIRIQAVNSIGRLGTIERRKILDLLDREENPRVKQAMWEIIRRL